MVETFDFSSDGVCAVLMATEYRSLVMLAMVPWTAYKQPQTILHQKLQRNKKSETVKATLTISCV